MTKVYVLKHDGQEDSRWATYNVALSRLLKAQSQSTHWAMKYEGWRIVEEEVPDGLVSEGETNCSPVEPA